MLRKYLAAFMYLDWRFGSGGFHDLFKRGISISLLKRLLELQCLGDGSRVRFILIVNSKTRTNIYKRVVMSSEIKKNDWVDAVRIRRSLGHGYFSGRIN